MKLISRFICQRTAQRPALAKIVNNIGWLFVDKSLRMTVGLFVGVWVARFLGPEQFGLLSFVSAFVGLFAAVAGAGLRGILVRDFVRDPEVSRSTLGSAIAIQLGFGLLVYGSVLAIIYALRPDDSAARVLVAIFGSSLLFRFSESVAAWFESQVLSKYVAIAQSLGLILFACVKVSLITLDASLTAFVWAMTLEVVFVAILSFLILVLWNNELWPLSFSAPRVKQLLGDSWPLLMSGVAITVYLKVDQIMLGQLRSIDEVGVYSAAVRLSEVWYFLPMIVAGSAFPAVLEWQRRDSVAYYRGLQQLLDLLVGLSIVLALLVTLLSKVIVTTLYGDAYDLASRVLTIHVWALVFVSFGVVSSKWYIAEGKQILTMQRTVMGAATNILLNLWLIPEYGVNGAAIATVASYAISDFLFDGMRSQTRQIFWMKLNTLNPLRLRKVELS